jgi:serine protease Do
VLAGLPHPSAPGAFILISAVTPLAVSLVPKARALARWVVPLLPIALALAIVTWWPRASAPRPQAGAAPVPVPTPVQTPAPVEDPEDREDRLLSEAIDRARVSTVALEYNSGEPSGMRRVATGVVFTPVGDVISVRVEPREARDRESIVARDSLGHEHPARFVAADPETGLTLLKVETEHIRPIRPSARAALIGATVFLIGHPYDLGPSVSLGNVAGLNRRVRYGDRTLSGLIHLQMALHPGDSGALLADRKGGWLGLIRGGLAKPDETRDDETRDDNNLGFAIPAPEALWVAEQLLAHRKVDRAYLGIQSGKDRAEPGARVFKVVPGSPAEKAGLLEGDRIVRLDDRPIRTRVDLTDRLDRIAAGTEVDLEFARGSTIGHVKLRTISRPPEVEPAPRPSATPAPSPATPPTP